MKISLQYSMCLLVLTLTFRAAYPTAARAESIVSDLSCPAPCLTEAPLASKPGFDPDLAADRHGNIHLVWHTRVTYLNTVVYYSARSVTGVWSAPAPVGEGVLPRVAVDGTGTVHVIWIAAGSRLQYNHKPPGAAWAVPLDLAPANAGASIVADSRGGAHVVYQCFSVLGCTDPDHLLYLERTPAGEWRPPAPVGIICRFFGLAIGPDDTLHISYRTYAQVFHRARLPDGQWSEPELVGGTGAIGEIELVADDTGVLHIHWNEYVDGPTKQGYYTSRANSTAAWSPAIMLPTADGLSDLATDSRGDVYMVSIPNSAFDHAIYYREKMLGSAWSAPVAIPGISHPANEPTITIDQQNRVHILIVDSFGQMHYYTTPALSRVYIPLARR